MSKAFVKDDGDAAPAEEALPERPSSPLPITPRGLSELRAELNQFVAAGKAESRRAKIIARTLETVIVREPALEQGGAGFGCAVTVEREDGSTKTYELVGPDEAKPELGAISIASPLARALLRQKPGATVVFKKPQGEEELTIVEVKTP